MEKNSDYSFTPLTLYDPKYVTSYEWEKSFDLDGWRKWMSHNWTISVYASIVYIVFIFGIQFLMKNRKPFRLTAALTTWNIVLAIFSMTAFLRTFPELFNIITGENGFHNSACQWNGHNYSTAFWSWLLLMSKIVELGDTVFVVLRKQNLIFLHWYHHITTLISWWIMYEAYEPNQLWYIVMNSFVHSIMYSYYALKALRVKVPRTYSMAITCIQLLQMIFGITVNVYALNLMWFRGKESNCARGYFGLKLSFMMYGSFFILFTHFFYTSYFKPKKISNETKTEKNRIENIDIESTKKIE